MITTPRLSGVRVLVVEDQFIIAMELAATLKRAGCEVIGPVGRLARAMELARDGLFDFALLDVNLFGERVFPVAYLLDQTGIPFALTTGYGELAVPAACGHWRVVNKPYDSDTIIALIIEMLRL